MTIFLEVVLRLYSLAKFSGQNRSMRVPIWSGKLAFHMAMEAFQVLQSKTVNASCYEAIWYFGTFGINANLFHAQMLF